ncbi:putative pumilio 7 [Hirschfeldia incana]|nr:putative pumilio 7 [Hirschfeldia incana]
MGEFREAYVSSSPLRTPSHSSNFSLLGQNYFHGDFSLNSSSDYSLSSSFSNGFCSSDDSLSSPFASPPFNGVLPIHNHATYHHDTPLHKDHEKSVYGDDHTGLCEDLHRMKVTEETETHGFVSGGFSWLNNIQDSDQNKRNMFGNQTHDSISHSTQFGWPSYSNSNVGNNSPYINGGGGGGVREHSAYYRTMATSDISPLFCQGSEPFSLDHQRTKSLISDHGNTSLPNVCDVQGYVYLMAKDQHGCRFLQRIFDEGTPVDAMVIFNEVIPHVVELMMDPFGNYLMQKLLDVCNEEQRTQIVLVATAEPGQLIRISLNAYGTRVVQRLVETIKTGKQVSLVKSALRPGFLDLIKDLNGNHVIQRCLQCLSTEDNKFIFDAATKFCTEIATHRHGCCVLQKCIAYSMRQQREKLIGEISRNSLLLAQDPFGNYAVQFVIELRIPGAVAMMLSQLKGHYVQLSMQKFSSHMVERCIMHCPESRPQIVRELVSVPHFDHLLQDPYANFVIQAALAATKGPLHASLVEVIRPHAILRNNPYCKRIFSRNLLKK